MFRGIGLITGSILLCLKGKEFEMNILKTLNTDLDTITKATKQYSPQLLTGFGIFGFGATIISTIKATRKVDEELKKIDIPEDASKKEVIWKKTKVVAPIVAPTVVLGASSVACIVGANKIQSARLASATAAYQITNKAFTEYKEAVIEEVGTKKEQKVRDRVAEKHIEESTYDIPQPVTATQLFCESLTGQYFRSTREEVLQGVLRFQKSLLVEDYMSVSEFFDYLETDELHHTSLTDACGFNSESGIEVYFSVAKAANGEPVTVLEYRTLPLYDVYG